MIFGLPRRERKAGRSVAACIAAVLVVGLFAAPASAEELNVSGTWEAVYHCEAGGCAGSNFPATAMLTQAPGSNHVVSPPDVEGTLNGNVLTLEGGSNGYHFVEHVTISADGKTWSGPLSDNNGTSGTDTATRVSGGPPSGEPPATPPPGPAAARHPTATQLSCGYHPLTASDTCTTEVRDTSVGALSTPTGIVTLTASGGIFGNGVFIAGSTCQLSGAGPTGLAICTVEYIPPTLGLTKLQADYAGDATHAPSSTGAPPATPKACPNSKSTTVTCADPTGTPGVCKAPGPIYPQCYQPTVIPTVCATAAIGTSCQPADNYTAACGSIGTGLPACALKFSSVPAQFCGPIGSGLPGCTGANNPITVCSASGSGLPQCAFMSKVTGAELDASTGTGEVDVTLSCPGGGASASGTQTEAGGLCPLSVTVARYLAVASSSLVKWQEYFESSYDAAVAEYFGKCDCASAFSLPGMVAAHNHAVAHARSYQVIRPNVTESRFRQDLTTRRETRGWVSTLTTRSSSSGTYTGPGQLLNTGGEERTANNLANAIATVVDEGHDLVHGIATLPKVPQPGSLAEKLSAGLDRGAQRIRATLRPSRKAPTPMVTRRLRIRPGQRVKIRLRLPRWSVRELLRSAGKNAEVVPLRIVDAYSTNPRTAVHFIDIPVRIKR